MNRTVPVSTVVVKMRERRNLVRSRILAMALLFSQRRAALGLPSAQVARPACLRHKLVAGSMDSLEMGRV